MKTMRISHHDIDRLVEWGVVLSRRGWRVVRPVYVDWFWRGYSLIMEPPDDRC
jgi:hypothetical protein